jgi:chitinase
VFDWHDITANYLPKMTRYWSDEAKVPWLYDPATGVMISYDDAESLTAKVDAARAKSLGGVMIWELSSDDSDHTLMHAVHDALAR